LLLDEPLWPLDGLIWLDMQRLIETLWLKTGFTAVRVAHDVNKAAMFADRVHVINEGRISQDQITDLKRCRQPGSALARNESATLRQILPGAAADLAGGCLGGRHCFPAFLAVPLEPDPPLAKAAQPVANARQQNHRRLACGRMPVTADPFRPKELPPCSRRVSPPNRIFPPCAR
jgi:energy-coupling factor transporter ATP-binding protein EcfA2